MAWGDAWAKARDWSGDMIAGWVVAPVLAVTTKGLSFQDAQAASRTVLRVVGPAAEARLLDVPLLGPLYETTRNVGIVAFETPRFAADVTGAAVNLLEDGLPVVPWAIRNLPLIAVVGLIGYAAVNRR